MNAKQLRPVCSLGMFDLLKGVGILSVIVVHTLIDFDTGHYPTLTGLFYWFAQLMLYCFAMAAGFSIRKSSVKKCAMRLKKMFLIPYIVTALTSALLLFINHYFLYPDLFSALQKGFQLLLAFAVGQHPSQFYGTFQMPGIGPAWFVVALGGGWFILNLILNYSSGWKRNLLVLFVSIIGYFGGKYSSVYGIPIPFCLVYMCDFVLTLYVGHLAREKNWLDNKLSPIAITLICASIVLFVFNPNTIYDWNTRSVAVSYAATAFCFGLVYLFTHINRRKNAIIGFFETVGHNSIYILCLHTVEIHSMHWYWFGDSLPNASHKHLFIMILLYRLVFIALGMLVINAFKNWGGFDRLLKRG